MTNASKNSGGRPPIGERAMTPAERARRSFAERKARGDVLVVVELPSELLDQVRDAARASGVTSQQFVATAVAAATRR